MGKVSACAAPAGASQAPPLSGEMTESKVHLQVYTHDLICILTAINHGRKMRNQLLIYSIYVLRGKGLTETGGAISGKYGENLHGYR